MTTLLKNARFDFEAGKYIIIDPCYIYPDEEWSDLCEAIYSDDGPRELNRDTIWREANNAQKGSVWQRDGFKLFIASTCWGDGIYPVINTKKEIGNCCVDAGLLSLIPIKLAQRWPEFEKNKQLGVIIDVSEDFVIKVFGHETRFGNWKFDDYQVLTFGEDEKNCGGEGCCVPT